jgi:sigma-B regulation protein RsbU (phosphoserine phosphatase)
MENLYGSLGLSDRDVNRLERHKMVHLLDKIKDQQHELERQKHELQTAFDKIEKDLSAARDAQMSLLPRDLVGVPEINFTARFFPSQYVSGDIYNIFRLDEHNIGAYHIDISGHGVPAALFSVSLSQILNTNVSRRNLLKVPVEEPPYYRINPPNEVIAMLNEDHSLDQLGIYFTMIYMIINLKERVIRYTRAGHNPPVIIHSNGEVEIPEDGGLPVGLDFPRNDEVIELNFFPGDWIFMYSDGVTEATNHNEDLFSTARMVEILKATRKLSIEASLDQLINSLREFTGQPTFDDDVSIIGLDCR